MSAQKVEWHSDLPGSPEWRARRARCYNASDAAAMLGCHPTKMRNTLLAQLHTGIEPEFSDYVQNRVIDPGHRIEEFARPIAEAILGDDLQALAATLDVGLSRPLGASYDGITFMRDQQWECKSINDELREALPHSGQGSFEQNDGTALPKDKRVQMEQQLLLSGCSKSLFSCAQVDKVGNVIEERHCWYASDPALRAEILAGWAQLEKDRAAYVPQEPTAPAPIGKTPETLPALRVEVTGMVTASTLEAYKAHAMAVFDGINRELVTDVQFADAEKTVKWCERVESELAATKRHALSQTASIDELFRAIDDIAGEARRVRLELDKLVKARKEAIKGEIVAGGVAALREHVAALNARLGKPYMPTVPADFGGCIKNLRTLDSLRNAVDTELSRAKIAANAVADTIQVNLALLQQHQALAFLFADVATIVLKPADDFAALVKSRIADHQAAEAKRLEAEREAIRAQEQARADREARERLAAEQAEAKRLADAGTAGNEPPASPLIAQGRFLTVPVPVPVVRQSVPDTGARIKLGDLNALLAPIALSSEGLKTLGFDCVATDKSAKLYRVADVPLICAALIERLQAVQAMGKT